MPVPPISWTITSEDGHLAMVVHGGLDLPGSAELRTGILKCLADQPDAILIDLSDLVVVDKRTLSLFTAMVRQAAMWPGIPLLICAAPPTVSEALASGRFGRLPVHATVAEALAVVAAGQGGPPAVVDQLLPIAGAPRHARTLVTEACTTWSLPDLIGPASLIVSELVTNAVEHAGTIMTLRISRRLRHLHLAVRDGSAAEPKPHRPGFTEAGGRGLLLVEKIATHWGSMPSRDGKVVWATLAI